MDITIVSRNTLNSGGIGTHTKLLINEMEKDPQVEVINLISPNGDIIEGEYQKVKHFPVQIYGTTFITKALHFFMAPRKIINKNNLQNTIILGQSRFYGKYKNLFHIFHGTHHGLLLTHIKFFHSWMDIIGIVFNFLYQFFDQYCFNSGKKNIFVSHRSMSEVNGLHPAYKSKNYYIPNFIEGKAEVNLPDIKVSSRNSERFKKKFILGYVGRLDPLKGVDWLCEELSKNYSDIKSLTGKDIELHIVGEGIMSDMIKKFKFTISHGYKSHSETIEFYDNIDLFIFPSKYENFPTVILEALSKWCLVLSRDVGDCNLILDSNQIFSHQNGDFFQKLVSLINLNDADYYNKIKNNYIISNHYTAGKIYLKLKKAIGIN